MLMFIQLYPPCSYLLLGILCLRVLQPLDTDAHIEDHPRSDHALVLGGEHQSALSELEAHAKSEVLAQLLHEVRLALGLENLTVIRDLRG